MLPPTAHTAPVGSTHTEWKFSCVCGGRATAVHVVPRRWNTSPELPTAMGDPVAGMKTPLSPAAVSRRCTCHGAPEVDDSTRPLPWPPTARRCVPRVYTVKMGPWPSLGTVSCVQRVPS